MAGGLTAQAKQTARRVEEVAELSIFQQPAAIKQLLPEITGLILALCQKVDILEGANRGG